MAGKIYKLVELIGTSEAGVSEAIESAVNRAAETLKGLDWFEVQQVRGRIVDGKVAEYQVDIKIGFRIMSPDELNTA